MEEREDILEILRKMTRNTKRHSHHGRHHHGGHKILQVLNQEGEMIAKDLAEKLDIRPSSLSEALDRLEKRGLIKRTIDENDQRRTLISLSDDAKKKMSGRKQQKDDLELKINQALSKEEIDQFIKISDKIINVLREESSEDVH